jgi:hypothetical protein
MGKKLDVMNLLEREILVGVGKFIHGGADGCPLCGSDQTDADGGLDQDGWTAWRLMRCNDCDGEWQELFEMSGLAFRTGKNGEWETYDMEAMRRAALAKLLALAEAVECTHVVYATPAQEVAIREGVEAAKLWRAFETATEPDDANDDEDDMEEFDDDGTDPMEDDDDDIG